ncbi:MAG: beta strand repeat-containing protein, partial [Chthoniobacterales bacterium]
MKTSLYLLAATALLVAPIPLRAVTIDMPYFTGTQGSINSGTYTVVNDGDTLFGDIFANSFEGITGGTFNFATLQPDASNIGSLVASTGGAVTGGDFTFHDITALAASAADAVTGGTFTFHDNSTLYASEFQSVSDSTLRLHDGATLSATVGDSVVSSDIEMHNSSLINIDADDALCDGTTITFSDAGGGDGGTLKLNGHDIPIGWISSASGGIITNESASNATLSLDFDTVTKTFNGLIEDGSGGGMLSLVKYGTGVQELGSANTYTGGTTINGGTLRVSNTSGSATGSGNVIVESGGTLDGNGIISGDVTVRGTIDPDVKLTTGDMTLDGGGAYIWEIRAFTGNPSDTDLLDTDALDITATNVSPFIVLPQLQTATNAFNFTQDYTWDIAQTTGITGFSADKFTINTAFFANFAPGSFAVQTSGNILQLHYAGTSTANVDFSFVTSLNGALFDGTVTFLNDGVTTAGSLTVDTAHGVDGGTQLFQGSSSLLPNVANAVSDGIQEFRDTSFLQTATTDAVTGGIQRFYNDSYLGANATGALSGANILLADNSKLYLNATNATGSGTRLFMDGTGGQTPTVLMGGYSNTFGRLSSPGTGATITNGNSLSAATLTIDSSSDTTFGGKITDGGGGVLSLVKAGSGVLQLSGNSNDYTGDTTVNDDGALTVTNTSGSATGSGHVTIGPDAALAGNGIISGGVTLNGTIIPGAIFGGEDDIATLSTGAQTWNPDAGYEWSIGAAGGVAGTGYDTVAITGGLDIAATAANQFHVEMATLGQFSEIGFMEDFDSAANYSWTIASTTSGITNFAANKFDLDLEDFVNPFNGSFSIAVSGNNLNIVYTGAAAIPIVSPYVTSVSGNLTSGVRTVTTGTVTSDTASGLSGGQQNFIASTLHANVANAVKGGFQIFSTGSTLDAAAADAITGGQQIFHDTSHLDVNAAGAISGGLQIFRGNSVLNADEAQSISGVAEQDFYDTSTLNAAATNAIVDGFQEFEDTSKLIVSAANAVSGGFQHFDDNTVLQFTPGGSVSGGVQNFFGVSYLDASVVGAVTGGVQGFHANSFLVASATNSVSGNFMSFQENSALYANATNAVQNSDILLGNDSSIVISVDDALAPSNIITFDNGDSSPGGTLKLNGFDATVGVIDSASGTHSGVIRNGDATLPSVLVVQLGVDVTSTFGGVMEDGGAAALALVKTGVGTLTLTGGSNTFSGGTIISAGALRVNNDSGNALGSGTVIVAPTGTLGGIGTITSSVTMNGTLSPGEAAHTVGTLHTNDETWGGGGTYDWSINDAAGSAGTGYDQLSVTGTVNITATPGDKFTIALNTLDANDTPGRLENFNTAISRTWTIATASTAFTSFDVAAFTLNMSGFVNAYNGTFAITNVGNDLAIEYTGAPAHII